VLLGSCGVFFGVRPVAVINKITVARQRTTMRWYFLSGPFWSCIKEAVGRGVTVVATIRMVVAARYIRI
jgi:hypothetical protein